MVFRSRENKVSIDGGSSNITIVPHPSIEHKSEEPPHHSNKKKRAVPMQPLKTLGQIGSSSGTPPIVGSIYK